MLETKKKYKILVIDNSMFNRTIMTSMLEKDYFLEEAYDCKQAILILEERAQEFSLVLLGIMKDSFEILKTMKECGWLDFLPAVVVFPEYAAENIETAYCLGASDIIQAPYNEKIFYHRIANVIALSMKHRKLSDALVNEVIQENENSSAIISILSHIVETRNGESGNHVRNIRNITNILLKELMKVSDQYFFSKEEILHICAASSLHDIGKMVIPEEILNKPGKLTDEEFQILKGHAMAGANMVDGLRQKGNVTPLIQMTYDICRWHHERYDGRGYPDGLKGEEIPIIAQVVSVADVYDALISERCYKPSYSPEKALQMILDGQCGAFNPLLLDCISRVSGELAGAVGISESENIADTESIFNSRIIDETASYLNKNGLINSENVISKLKREHLCLNFFFNEEYPAFYYTVSSKIMHYNVQAVKLFGVEKAIIKTGQKSYPHEKYYDHYAAERLRHKLAATTNEHPLVKETVLVNLPGEKPRRYQCVMQTIWNSADARHYSDVVGRLIPLDNEGSASATVEEEGRFSPFGDEMTGKEVYALISALKIMVYNVRLVDTYNCNVMDIDRNGRIFKVDDACFHIWNQNKMCSRCICMMCTDSCKKKSKIVFFKNEVFYVLSKYIKVDGKPLALEMLIRITDDALISEDEKQEKIYSISDMHRKLYHDPITYVYNRRYFDMKIRESKKICALAILDVDHFKDINNTHGRSVGDNVLIGVAMTIRTELGTSDVLVRLDGDEFVILFSSIAQEIFEAKLKKICDDIAALSIEGMEAGRHISVSIGGAVGPDVPAALMERADERLLKAKKRQGTVEV